MNAWRRPHIVVINRRRSGHGKEQSHKEGGAARYDATAPAPRIRLATAIGALVLGSLGTRIEPDFGTSEAKTGMSRQTVRAS